MKLPNIDEGSCSSGVGMSRGPRIVPVGGLGIPNIRGDACPSGVVTDIQHFLGRSAVGRGWCLANGILVRETCPVVTSYPQYSWSNGIGYAIYYDETRQHAYINNQANSSVDIIDTATNSFIAQHVGVNGLGGNLFGSFGIAYDPVNDMVVAMSQAHGYSSFNPRTLTWTGLQGQFTGFGNDAGLFRYLTCDTKRGHTFWVAFSNGPNYGYEITTVDGTTGVFSLVHADGSLTETIDQEPVYNAAADKFVIRNRNGTGFPLYYLDPVTYVITASTVSSASSGGVFNLDPLPLVAFKAGGTTWSLVNVATDTLVASGLAANGFTGRGAVYQECANLIYLADSAGAVFVIDPANGYSSNLVAGQNATCMVFDKYTGLVSGVYAGGMTIHTF